MLKLNEIEGTLEGQPISGPIHVKILSDAEVTSYKSNGEEKTMTHVLICDMGGVAKC